MLANLSPISVWLLKMTKRFLSNMQRSGYVCLMWQLSITASLASTGSCRFWMHVCFRDRDWEIPEPTPGIWWLGRRHRASVFLRQKLCMESRHAHFRPVDFDYQVYIRGCENSSDGKLFACWSSRPSLGFTNWSTCLQVVSVLGGWNWPLTNTDSTSSWCQTHRSLVSRQKCNTSILVVCTLKFWVEHVHTWCLYEVDQSWCVIWAYIARHARWMGDGSSHCFGTQSSRDNLYVP